MKGSWRKRAGQGNGAINRVCDETLDRLGAVVCECFGVNFEDLFSQSQSQAVVRIRHAFTLIARNEKHFSFPSLGAYLGRDHTTLMSGYKRAECLMEYDPLFRLTVKNIYKAMKGLALMDVHSFCAGLPEPHPDARIFGTPLVEMSDIELRQIVLWMAARDDGALHRQESFYERYLNGPKSRRDLIEAQKAAGGLLEAAQ